MLALWPCEGTSIATCATGARLVRESDVVLLAAMVMLSLECSSWRSAISWRHCISSGRNRLQNLTGKFAWCCSDPLPRRARQSTHAIRRELSSKLSVRGSPLPCTPCCAWCRSSLLGPECLGALSSAQVSAVSRSLCHESSSVPAASRAIPLVPPWSGDLGSFDRGARDLACTATAVVGINSSETDDGLGKVIGGGNGKVHSIQVAVGLERK